MSEFIVLQIGQCGNQIGHAFWQLVLNEHGVCVNNGKPSLKKLQDEALHSFFNIQHNKRCFDIGDLIKCKAKARAVLIDMEKNVVERFHVSKLRELFDGTYSLTDSPGSGNNWAFGYHEAGKLHGDKIREIIRHAAEVCPALHGFLLFFSLSGGTGSGLGSAILNYLKEDFPFVESLWPSQLDSLSIYLTGAVAHAVAHIRLLSCRSQAVYAIRIVVCVHPGHQVRDVVTCPYNIAFSLSKLIEAATCVLPIDNKALEKICTPKGNVVIKKTFSNDLFFSNPYQKMNTVIVKMLLNLTSGSRFPGSLNFDLSDLPTTLVPYNGMHFLSSSLSPITLDKGSQINILKRKNEVFYAACSEENHLLQINSLSGRVHAAAILARGDISFSTVTSFQDRLLKKLKYPPIGVTTGLCSIPPSNFPLSVLLLTNSSSMSSFFSNSVKDFNTLFSRKAFIHHYLSIDQFEMEDFLSAREALLKQVDIYSKHYEDVNIPRFQIEM